MSILNLKKTLSFLMMSGAIILVQGCSNRLSEKQLQPQTETATMTSDAKAYKAFLDARIENESSIGLAVVIIDNNQEEILTIGFSNPAQEQKVDADTLFEIGSITKTFTALILADMVIKGEVKLDDPASIYLPESVTMPEFNGQKITLKDLATHTSALPSLPSNYIPSDVNNPYVDFTYERMYAFLSGYKLDRPIGQDVVYSNLGMGLLGHILELHTGQPYERLVTERILNPLSMHNSFITIPPSKTSKFAIGHDPTGQPTSHWDVATLAGAGALRSDISDMTKYLKANMGLIETPLSAAIKMSHEFQHMSDTNGGYIGLAWFIHEMDGKKVTWHNGGTGGFRTFLGFDLKNKRGVVVLANSSDQADLIGQSILTGKPEMLEPDAQDVSITFSPEQLERFVGDYQLAPAFIISITKEDDKLFLQATGQPKLPIFVKSEMEFFLKAVEASVIFEENNQGEITTLILDQGGVKQPASKL